MTTAESIDVAWLLLCAVLVLLMQAGFTALESGLVRSKNSVNVAIKNFANFLVAASLFWLFGFGLMFGADEAGLVGRSSFLFDSDDPARTAFFLFQLGFIGTATTLMSGAVAERMRFAGYLVLVVLVAAVIYPVFGHWAWGDASRAEASVGSNGWLKEIGFVDFAGSTVVHSTGGWAALAAIVVIGPRIGRFGPGRLAVHGHDLPLTTLGVFVLWVGWYGFNGGSTFALTDDVPSVILNTSLAATFGGLVGMTLTWRRDRRPDVVMIMNGSLAGLVAVTASANIISPGKAAIVGGVAAVVMLAVTVGLERLRIDDAVGAVPVHLGAGVWGTLAVALLGDVEAFPSASGRLEQAGVQLAGVVVCCAWAFGVTLVSLKVISGRFRLRIDRDGELAGLNISEHGASTEIADLLGDIDQQRRSGDFARPVRVEPHTEVGRIAAEYNRVVTAIGRRTEALQLLRRTAAAANQSSSLEEALGVALREVCRFTGWPIGRALLVSREDADVFLHGPQWNLADDGRRHPRLDATEAGARIASDGVAGHALRERQIVLVERHPERDSAGGPPARATLTVMSGHAHGHDDQSSVDLTVERAIGCMAPTWAELGLRAGIAVPIVAGSEIAGVLEFISDEPLSADDELVDLLLRIGAQLARVVERERSEEARLRTLIDNMPASVYLRDLEGRFILVNREYEAFWMVSNDEIRGRTLVDTDRMSAVSMSPDANAGIDRGVIGTGESQRREVRVVRNGREHVLADVRFPVLDTSGKVVAIAGIDIDITGQKRNEAEMAELLRRVETARDAAMDAASAKSRFLANMSHELRTPLNAIIGFTRLVSRNSAGLPDKQVDNLAKILLSAEQLLVLIDEILDLSRIDAGGVHVEIAETDVGGLVREVTDSLEPLVERSRVRIIVDVEASLSPVPTDRDKVKQILLNLLSNAIKYTDDGTIGVRAWRAAGRLRFAVSDTGLGIATDELGRIFDEFHRAESTTARMRRGTGLGLAISRRLARALGGDVTVESRLGIGSTFTLDLPLSHAVSGTGSGDRTRGGTK